MPLICVCSPNGGTGKTTLAANLVWSFARSGIKALALDFNVQNSLRLHFGSPPEDVTGYVSRAPELADWSQSVLTPGGNVFFLPYGQVTETQRMLFDEGLSNDPMFISRGLNTLLNYPGLIIVADFPAGPGPALKAASSLADLFLVVLQPDPVSLSCQPVVEEGKLTGNAAISNSRYRYVINQVDARNRLASDVQTFFEQKLGPSVIGAVHNDESVREASAQQKSIFDFNAVSAASFDIELISKRLSALLDLNVGDGMVTVPPDFRVNP
ncbi:TPA: cellulose synthase operon protein YhjQ [Citrobacter freundii]|nr:cellulose synthase operon protein YhjQ [Citrobacter freundii]